MTKKVRTILFSICVILFVLTAPSVVLYSQGYRVDFEKKRIVQTGAFYFKVLPGRAEVYLNGKFKNRTSMITNSVLIKNLLPKTYEIEIKKAGFHSWEKNLEVREKEVTEAKNIILFPQNPQFAIVDQGPPEITASATSTDKKKVVESNNYEIWVVFPKEEKESSSAESDSATEDKEKMFLTRFSEKIGNIFWLNDYYLIFNVGNKIKIIEIDERDRLNIIDLAEFENPKIFWDKDSKKLYVLSKEKLYLLENLLP